MKCKGMFHSQIIKFFDVKSKDFTTCQWIDGEGLVGLNNIHLEFKVSGTAASQRNSMAYTGDRWEKKWMRSFFLMI